MENGSPVLETMRQATTDSWRAWRRHVEAGTADTAEGVAAFERSRLASATYSGERAGRERFTAAEKARVA
jgi:hypothetical protein